MFRMLNACCKHWLHKHFLVQARGKDDSLFQPTKFETELGSKRRKFAVDTLRDIWLPINRSDKVPACHTSDTGSISDRCTMISDHNVSYGSRQITLIKRHEPVSQTWWLLGEQPDTGFQMPLEMDKTRKLLLFVLCLNSGRNNAIPESILT